MRCKRRRNVVRRREVSGRGSSSGRVGKKRALKVLDMMWGEMPSRPV
jgi:hypothetical protein